MDAADKIYKCPGLLGSSGGAEPVTLISYCTTVRDRWSDLHRTLRHNLPLLRADEEIVLLDYGCPRSCGQWAAETYFDYVQSGALRVLKLQAPRFLMAHAKNVAHQLGAGKFLVNLDADNYLSSAYQHQVRQLIETGVDIAWPEGTKGGRGRVFVRRGIFYQVRGYDEAMNAGWGCEDVDFCNRAIRAGAPYQRILLSDVDVIETPELLRIEAQLYPKRGLQGSLELHRMIARGNEMQERIKVNVGKVWGYASLRDQIDQLSETGAS